jgi:hypothetical protein
MQTDKQAPQEGRAAEEYDPDLSSVVAWWRTKPDPKAVSKERVEAQFGRTESPQVQASENEPSEEDEADIARLFRQAPYKAQDVTLADIAAYEALPPEYKSDDENVPAARTPATAHPQTSTVEHPWFDPELLEAAIAADNQAAEYAALSHQCQSDDETAPATQTSSTTRTRTATLDHQWFDPELLAAAYSADGQAQQEFLAAEDEADEEHEEPCSPGDSGRVARRPNGAAKFLTLLCFCTLMSPTDAAGDRPSEKFSLPPAHDYLGYGWGSLHVGEEEGWNEGSNEESTNQEAGRWSNHASPTSWQHRKPWPMTHRFKESWSTRASSSTGTKGAALALDGQESSSGLPTVEFTTSTARAEDPQRLETGGWRSRTCTAKAMRRQLSKGFSDGEAELPAPTTDDSPALHHR